jgi:predicted O-methyltransferase YrrM
MRRPRRPGRCGRPCTIENVRHICVREPLQAVLPRRWRDLSVLEAVCQHLGHERLLLPEFDVDALFPGFSEASVTFSRIPLGDWSVVPTEQLVLAKLVCAMAPTRVLEVGSFRGYTARVLAENAPAHTSITALDPDERHGEAYEGTNASRRIERIVGSFEEHRGDVRYDFIFLDADHTKSAVEKDTATAFALLAPGGVLVWHDYADWGWLNEENRVPEVLNELAKSTFILRLPGTLSAIHRDGWARDAVDRAVRLWEESRARDRWHTRSFNYA